MKLFWLLIIISYTSFAQWSWQNFKPQGNNLNSVFFLSEEAGWAVGDLGTILKTTNGGNTWDVSFADSTVNLNAVHFINSSIGYAVGNSGIVLKTTDDGSNWQMINYNPIYNFNVVHFISDNIGWIGGSKSLGLIDSTLFRTNDGGETWECLKTLPGFEPSAIHFLSDSIGWIVGFSSNREMYCTNDGGNSWQTKLIDNDFYPLIFPVTESNIFCVDNFGTFGHTTNGGKSWESKHITYNNMDVHFGSVFFISESVGWLTAGYYETPSSFKTLIYKTTDGGETLQPVKTNINCAIGSLYFVSEKVGYAVGNHGLILKTSDGGLTWIEQSKANDSYINSFYAVDFVSKTTGYAVGTEGLVIKTTNGGNDWLTCSSDSALHLLSVDFVNEDIGWACGMKNDVGYIYKSTNGGKDWNVQYKAVKDYLIRNVFFISDKVGWATALDSILYTSDGGETWQNQYGIINTTGWWDKIFFVNENVGWCVGPARLIYKTVNGGKAWQQIDVPVQSKLPDCEFFFSSIQFVNEQVGWIVGSGGLILKSADGGETWQEQMNIGEWHYDLYGMSFLNENRGWAVGAFGNIFKTTDGGKNWIKEKSRTDRDLYDITVLDENTGWIVGKWGAILKLNDSGKSTSDMVSEKLIPGDFMLFQNYPNPFNPSTIIDYFLPKAGNVTLKIFDSLGREVIVIVNEFQNAGKHSAEFTTSEVSGVNISSGIYYYQLKLDNYVSSRKMLMIK